MWMYNSVYPEIAAKRGVTLSPYSEAVYNASLMLVNSHPSIGGSIKLPQNVKNVGGYHIDTDVKPLPKVNLLYSCLYYYHVLTRLLKAYGR